MSAHPDHEYKASLRVFSDSMTATELTARLGEPSESYERGDPVSSRPGASTRRRAMWRIESGLDRSRTLDEHLLALADFVEERQEAFESIRDRCDIDIFCGIFSGDDGQGGFVIQPSLSDRLARLRLPVAFDIY